MLWPCQYPPLIGRSTFIYNEQELKNDIYKKTAVDVTLVFFFALLTAGGGAIKIPFLPYHPNTPQVIPVILSGAMLGSTRGPLSQILFIFLGLLGLPLFNELSPTFPTPADGASPLFAKTGLKAGWLMGFVAASYMAGRVVEYAKRYDYASIGSAILGSVLLIYLIGLGVPLIALRMPFRATFIDWLWPFFVADLGKGLLIFVFLMNTRKVLTPPSDPT